MQEDSGNRKSTQSGRPALQSQIRRHSFHLSSHSRRHGPASRTGGRDIGASHHPVIDDPRRFLAKPAGASMPGARE